MSGCIDLQGVREDTPSCARRLHLNNAGCSPSPGPVRRVMIDHLELEAEIGGYAAEDQAAERLARVYASLARLIGAHPSEVAFAESATHAWRLAFHAVAWKPGDRILTSRADYASNVLEYLRAAERLGVEVETVPNDDAGGLDVGALAAMLDQRVKLVAVTHAPAHSGLLQPAAAIGAALRGSEALYLLDACQSVGQLPVDVAAIGCHLLSATGRKFLRAPRGTGFLYVAGRVAERLEPPFIDLHAAHWTGPRSYVWAADARRFESWESPVAAKLALGAAADYALGLGLEPIADRNRLLAARLRERLSAIGPVELTDAGRERSAIVTFRPRAGQAAAVAASLEAAGVSATALSRASAQLDFAERGIEGVVRLSPHYFNTEAEIDAACEQVARLAGGALAGAAA